MEIKIEELHNRLTILLMNSESYSHLYDWLNLDEDELLNDIKSYIHLDEGEISKNDLEEEIESGLSSLMDFYENDWTVYIYDDEDSEEEVGLSEAMSEKKVSRFRCDWKLKDLKSEWDIDEVILIDEEDDFSLGDYYSDYQ